MDALCLAGSLTYIALSVESVAVRNALGATAMVTLLTEAYLLRTDGRAPFLIAAVCAGWVPATKWRIPAYYSYHVFQFVYGLTTELVVGAVIVWLVVYYCVQRPRRERRRVRRATVPIRPAQGAVPKVNGVSHPAGASRKAAPAPAAAPANPASRARTAASAAAASALARSGAPSTRSTTFHPTATWRAPRMTRSHQLAAKLYAESEAAKPAAVVRRRAVGERRAAERDCAQQVTEAEAGVERARERFQTACTASVEADRVRDAARKEADNAEYDELRQSAMGKEREKAEALAEYNAAMAALRDVHAWADRVRRDL